MQGLFTGQESVCKEFLNCSLVPPIMYCSWRTEPRGIVLGPTLTGCPQAHPTALWELMKPCCTLRITRTMRVCGAGIFPFSARGFTQAIQWDWRRTKVLFYSWFDVPLVLFFPLPLSAVICQRLHGEWAALQDATARDPQQEPGKLQPRQCLFSGLRQQGVQPRPCPRWWVLNVIALRTWFKNTE